MHRTITIHERKDDCGFGRIAVTVNIDGYQSRVGTNDADVAVEMARKALAGEYDRCMEEGEAPAVKRCLGDFDNHPSNEQMEYFKRGGR